MYILTEIFVFIELLCTCGVDIARESVFYQIIHGILSHELLNVHYAIPHYVIFEETDYIPIILEETDCIYPTIVYDEISKCFVFLSMHDVFIGMKSILKKLHTEYPDDQNIQDKFHQITMFMSIVNNSMSMDDLCESMNKL